MQPNNSDLAAFGARPATNVGFGRHTIRILVLTVISALSIHVIDVEQAEAQAGSQAWRRAPDGSVLYPAGVFPILSGKTERHEGLRYTSQDGQATFAHYVFDNRHGEAPDGYLRRTLVVDQNHIIYKRVNPRFFVISSIRDKNIYYSRCNFGSRVRCIYLEYPAAQKKSWDRTVTTISNSLR